MQVKREAPEDGVWGSLLVLLIGLEAGGPG